MSDKKHKFEELREKNKTMIGNEVVSPRAIKDVSDQNLFQNFTSDDAF
jgi:hypothetical protein